MMMRSKWLLLLVLALLGGGLFFTAQPLTDSALLPGPDTVACTLEAKQCPDGSFVGRTGPNCEFTACPEVPDTKVVDSFEDCVAAGNPVMESYPEQCEHLGEWFVKEIDTPITIFPIRYGEDVSNMEEYRADCAEQGGVFNECGSACGPEAEVCMAVCSMICEAP